ncbi:uncharacterized protein Z520_06935 [Fonsecaea multimorphosa CBS 102226]|uniref:Peptidase S1 domain-containing protein n=1 Tax=Fonsecaea multimorphosa CBS 102226 TaxID=1442371 RepID=A0A0D2KLG8_9EURO|nr:uncharacterized protein Z520_06935 [Fonsecaea multimorphosa CBS 102226]KIX97483.1 hypothetical protein Z520_06935 [Fonsecaea multimorphosa CBS 102226]OAL23445.1 hypothetical protein AYO22_06495 [Fonsecaea multimorphosa]
MASSKTNDTGAENDAVAEDYAVAEHDAVADQSQQNTHIPHPHNRSSSGDESLDVPVPDFAHPQTAASSPSDGRSSNNSNVQGSLTSSPLSPTMTSTVLEPPALAPPILNLPAFTPTPVEEPPYQPDNEETYGYYHGLPSCPLLVARSSGQPWRSQLPEYPFPRTKTLGVVGKHPIRDAWDAKLQAEIIEALGTTRWTSIDILRIGYAGLGESKGPLPVVLWIGVRPGSLTWGDGITIVEACVAILRREKLIDVQCEIRESAVHASARPSPRYSSSPSLPSVLATSHLPFTASPGQSINPVGSSIHGTLGLYLQPGENNPYRESVWAVTCRHVVIPDEDKDRKYEYKPTGQPCVDILIPSDKALEKITSAAEVVLNSSSFLIRTLEESARGTVEQHPQLDKERLHLRECKDFVEKILPKWQSTTNRTLGYVKIAPPIQTSLSMNPSLDLFGPRRDWALIEVDKAKHPEAVANTVDAVTGLMPEALNYRSMLIRHLETYKQDSRPGQPFDGKLLRLGRVVPIEELRAPKMRDPQEDPCLIVGKRGGVSDMTWGYLNGLKSVCWNDDNTKSMEMCVVTSTKKKAFSEDGDSGSAVFDVTGRVVGILVGGAKGPCDRESLDVTYVTPMAWLQKDMKDCGYGVEIA